MLTQATAIVSGARLTASERLTNGRSSRPSAKRPQRSQRDSRLAGSHWSPARVDRPDAGEG